MKPDFGDTVRVLPSDETDSKALTGKVGSVYGITTPSVTEIEIIGDCSGDYSVNVYFDELERSYWFAPNLLEFIDHGEGMEITLDGVDKKWVRNNSGGWDEIKTKKSWWRFWS